MKNVFVEPRPKGEREDDPIEEFVVEDYADHVLATFKSRDDAIRWARSRGYHPHVAKVRHRNDKRKADHWRRV